MPMDVISILLERQTDGFRASVLGLPNCQAQGSTREAALANVQQALTARLQSAEIVTIPLGTTVFPKLAGIFKDDPQWDDFQAAIAAHRHTVDAELAAEYAQLDEADRALNPESSAA
jgi:predicted RNase H-like HicB family nuclease